VGGRHAQACCLADGSAVMLAAPGEDKAGLDARCARTRVSRPDAEEIHHRPGHRPIVGVDTGPATGGTRDARYRAGARCSSPPARPIAIGAKVSIFGQVYVAGETESTGTRANIEGQLGYGPRAATAASEATWLWTARPSTRTTPTNDELQKATSRRPWAPTGTPTGSATRRGLDLLRPHGQRATATTRPSRAHLSVTR